MYEYRICHSISEIDQATWNSLCPADYPFIRHEFLAALEQSGCVCAETGWQPVHLQILEHGQTAGLLPMYLKSHSYGEYVFDWAWADAYHRHRLRYYPKLVTAIPYSPVTGPRLLCRKQDGKLAQQLALRLPEIATSLNASSWHYLFLPDTDLEWFAEPLISRQGCQYHWFNRDYQDFEHYLSFFTSRKRKNLRKERKKVSDQQISLSRIEGCQITETHLEQFYQFYQATYWKRGQQPYLNLDFFLQLWRDMPQHLLLIVASQQQKPVAAAFCLKDSTTLYGRYWGCLEEYDNLHFETCYYQGIEYCIETGLQRFDPGAQGEHKIQRGFEPVPTYSIHWLQDKGFNQAIRNFTLEEQLLLQQQMTELSSHLPFKQG